MSSMKPRVVWLEPSRENPIVVGLGACAHYLAREAAIELRRQLSEVLDEELPTRRDTPLAVAAVRDTDPAPRTTSSAGFKAVNVTRHFEEVKKGTPPDSQGKP